MTVKILLYAILFIMLVSSTQAAHVKLNGTQYYEKLDGSMTATPSIITETPLGYRIDWLGMYYFTIWDGINAYDTFNYPNGTFVSPWVFPKIEYWRTTGSKRWVEVIPLNNTFEQSGNQIIRRMTMGDNSKFNITYTSSDKIKYTWNFTAGANQNYSIVLRLDSSASEDINLASKRYTPGWFSNRTFYSFSDVQEPYASNVSSWYEAGNRKFFQRIILGQQAIGNSTEIDPSIQFNGSTSPPWQNTSMDGSINNPNDGTIENDLQNDRYISRWKGGVQDWNRTTAADTTLYGNAVWNSTGLFLDGAGDYAKTDAVVSQHNFSGNMSILASLKNNNSANTDEIITKQKDGSPWNGWSTGISELAIDGKSGMWVGGSAWTGSATAVNDGIKKTLGFVYNGSVALWIEGGFSNSQVQTANMQANTQTRIGIHPNEASNAFLGEIYEIVIFNKELNGSQISNNLSYRTTSNTTHWNDVGAGNEVYQIDVNTTTPTNTNYSVTVMNNDTDVVIQTWTSQTGNNSFTITGAVQDTKVNITRNGNQTVTPKLIQVTFWSQAVSGGGATYIPPTPISCTSINGTNFINLTCSAGTGNVTTGMNFTNVNTSAWSNGTAFFWNNTGLSSGTLYDYRIYAYNDSGGGTLNATYANVTNTTLLEAVVNYIPPDPINLAQTNSSTGFWINYTWQNGTGNITNSYNVSVNGTWTNSSANNFSNGTISPHGWRNITVWDFNSSGNGNLSAGSVALNTQILNNVPVQQSIGDKSVNENSWLNFSVSSTDADGDALTYATNATKGTLSGYNFSWKPDLVDAGTYYWIFNTTDNYSAVATETITITVNNINFIPPVPTIDTVTTGNFYVNTTWNAGSGNVTNSYNSTNGTVWINGTNPYRNTTLSAHAWQNLTIYAWNSSYGNLSVTALTNNTQIPNNAISISNVSTSYSITEGQTLNIDADYTDADSDSGTFSDNATQWNVNSGTGIVSWLTADGDQGTYNWNISVVDGYGSTSIANFTVTISDSTPTAISNLQNTTFNFGINWTWDAGNNADDYDVQINSTDIGYDNTTRYYNSTYSAHATRIINIRSHNHTLDSYSAWVNQTTTIPNNIPVLSSIGNKTVNENQLLSFSLTGSDADSDAITCSTNATKGTLTDCDYSWTPNYTESGSYIFIYYYNDSYGGSDSEIITIIVNNIPLNISSFLPASDPSSTQGISQAFNITTNRTANVTWLINGTQVQYNSSVTIANYSNITAGIGVHNVTANVNESATSDTDYHTWNWTVNPSVTYPSNITTMNNKTNNTTLSVTINTSEALLINATANQTIDYWRCDGMTNVSGNGTTSGSCSQVWVTASTYYANISGNNSNGVSNWRNYTIIVQNLIYPPNITSWSNNKTNNNSFSITINTSEGLNLNATANQTIATWLWAVNGSDQSNNQDNLNISWATAGLRNVSVNGTNSNGTTQTIYWNVTVQSIPTTNYPPNITSYFNNISGWNQSTVNINAGNSALFNATVNQTPATVSFKINGTEEQNASNLQFNRTFNVLGTFNLTVQANNSNGSSQIVYTVITVVASGGSGTNWDYLTGYVNDDAGTPINLAWVNTSQGNVQTNSTGYFNFSYVFEEGIAYWINGSKQGYQSNNTLLTFNEDHEELNITLSQQYPPNITSWGNSNTSNNSISLTVLRNTNITFNITANQSVTTTWTNGTVSPTKINGTNENISYAYYNFTSTGAFTVIPYCSNTNGTCTNPPTWTITVTAIGGYTLTVNVKNTLELNLQNARVDFNGGHNFTDANGNVQFTNVDEGTYSILARATQYNNKTTSQSIASDVTTNITLTEARTAIVSASAPGTLLNLFILVIVLFFIKRKHGK